MTQAKFEFSALRMLLRRPADSADVLDLIQRPPPVVSPDDYRAYVELKDEGFSIIFTQAQFLSDISDSPSQFSLYLSGFQFYKQDYEGYSEYTLQLPCGIHFGESQSAIRAKLGQPQAHGGGKFIQLLNKRAPSWLRYNVGSEWLHIQFAADDTVELVTFMVPEAFLAKA